MRITACKAEEDYKLWLRFEDGLEGRVFLGNLLEIGAFQLWRDVREFEKVSVDPETATVTWDGGIRLDADILYHDVKANQIQRVGAGETAAGGWIVRAEQPGLYLFNNLKEIAEWRRKKRKKAARKRRRKGHHKEEEVRKLKKAAGKKKSAKKKKKAGKKKKAMKAARPVASPAAPMAASAALPSTAATSSARPALNPAAAWPFPTGSRP